MSEKDHRMLHRVTEEARDHLHGDVPDWEKIEQRLLARIETDRTTQASLERFAGHRRVWGGVAGALAIAAGIAIFTGRPTTHTLDRGEAPQAPANASALLLCQGCGDGRGQVQVAGGVLSAGQNVRAGDVIETRGASAVFERPHAVTWQLEDASKVIVKKAGASLVLALDHGVIEAQVTPVAAGESFAVDVSSDASDTGGSESGVTRIAVHGTHLRVARVGPTRVLIDLTEGVVSIGAPPRAGSTNGVIVTAPAHVEIDLASPQTSLQVTHNPTAVHPPIDLAAVTHLQNLPNGSTSHSAEARPKGSPSPTSPLPAGHVPPSSVPTPKAHEPLNPVLVPDPDAESTIAAAVRGCASSHLPSLDPSKLRVTVSSNLELRVSAEGLVEFARFDPPLRPEVQACAATSIYKTRFTHSGTVSIPLIIE